MDSDGWEVATLANLTRPIDKNRCRTNGKEMRLPLVLQGDHRSNCLDGFSQAHFIAKENLTLVKNEPNSPFLILAQTAAQASEIRLFTLECFSNDFWKPI